MTMSTTDSGRPKRDWLTPQPAPASARRSSPSMREDEERGFEDRGDRRARRGQDEGPRGSGGGSGQKRGPSAKGDGARGKDGEDKQDHGKADKKDDAQGGSDEKEEGKGKEDDAKKGDGKPDKPKKPLPWWPFVLAAVVVVAFAAVVLWIIFRPRPDVWTDDAYVRVHYTTVAPRVSGQIASVPVEDNQVVKAGDLLAEIDPRDYQTALDAAEAQLQRDQAQTGDIGVNIERQPSIIDESSADVDSARARLAFSQADARRFDNLVATGAGSNQQHQQADATLQQNQAALRSAQAQLDASKKQLDALKKQQQASEATVKADRAQVEQAKLNLSYTRILAKLDGMVAQRSVQVGNYVTAGATLMTLVPLQQVYVTANYREEDLRHVRAGQHATVHVDAYDIDLDGVVNGVPAASGATFSPIEPNNATGNFTKIVQRLPVKIDISPNQPLANLLRVGFSVETTIHTDLQDVVAEQRHDPRAVTGR
ncbi:HlyD family secretion protein [Lichenibacterium dinghuense]|uniref:HlyD family secretion protein n=1 Tax=Lichenibacterium dinghuense TaxID=2895977 RepID=UPI001F30E84E|nr:HlyD family secretion protein [Lichenibacterium sp. 6Y81]